MPAARGDRGHRLARLGQAPLDPRAQLADRRRRRPLGGARGQHHLDARVGVHVDAHAPGARERRTV